MSFRSPIMKNDMKTLKKISLEKISDLETQVLTNAKMNRIKGGYTLNTITVTPDGNSDDGKDCEGD